MKSPVALHDHEWRTTEFPLCQLSTSVAQLSARVRIPATSWNEDGLGQAHGFTCRLSSGLVVLVAEFAGSKGTMIAIEAADLVRIGIEGAMAEVLPAFAVSKDAITWTQEQSGVVAAAEMLKRNQSGSHDG